MGYSDCLSGNYQTHINKISKLAKNKIQGKFEIHSENIAHTRLFKNVNFSAIYLNKNTHKNVSFWTWFLCLSLVLEEMPQYADTINKQMITFFHTNVKMVIIAYYFKGIKIPITRNCIVCNLSVHV